MKRVFLPFLSIVFVLGIYSLGFGQEYYAPGFSKVLSILEQPKTQTAVDSVILPQRIADLDEVHAGYDFDGDGNMEFFYVTDETGPNSGLDHGTSNAVYLYEYNPSTGNYDLIWQYSAGAFSWASFPTACVADLDGDGNKELVLGIPYSSNQPTADANPDRMVVFEGEPGKGLPDVPTATWNFEAPPATNTRPSAMAAGDIDGDGKDELAVGFRKWPSAAGSALMICSLDGDFSGIFTAWKIEAIDTTSGYGSDYSADITDVDNDGHKEALFSIFSGSGPQVFYEATGPDTYEKHVLDFYTYKTIQGASHFDANNDGKQEVVLGRTNGTIALDVGITDLATADSTNTPIVATVEPGGIRGLAAGDFDKDGNGDIFIGGNYAGSVWRMEYKGSGDVGDSASYTYTKVFNTDTARGARIYDISFPGDSEDQLEGYTSNDMDGDGNPELLVAVEDGDSLQPRFYLLEAANGGTVVETKPMTLVRNYELNQNYPNPFNPTTEISYSLKKAGRVTITIYNALGEKVRTLVNEQKAPGSYKVMWDATSDAGVRVPSGVYYCSLHVNNFKATRQMVLMK